MAGLAEALGIPGAEWDQGDIVEAVYFAAVDANLPAILVTPACDVAQDKVDYWTLVALFPDVEVASAIVEKELQQWTAGRSGELSKGQRGQLAKDLRGLLTQRFPRYHWVPVPIGESRCHVADFSCVTALPVDEVKTVKRLATLRSSWREQLPARYAAYMARVGTADFEEMEVQAEIERILLAVIPTSAK